MQIARRDAVFGLTGFGLGIVVTIVGSLLLPQLHFTSSSTQTNTITPVLSTFEGTLLIDHGQSYLAQSSRGLASIQTPLIMGYSDTTSADLGQLTSHATGYFLQEKHSQNGAPIRFRGFVVAVGNVPFIEVVRDP
jgi:hypothetical protein